MYSLSLGAPVWLTNGYTKRQSWIISRKFWSRPSTACMGMCLVSHAVGSVRARGAQSRDAGAAVPSCMAVSWSILPSSTSFHVPRSTPGGRVSGGGWPGITP